MKKELSLISVFWGEWHTEMFLDGCIPSLLADKNIPSIADKFNINYLISTNKSNLFKIQNNYYYLELKKYINIELCLFEDYLIPSEIGDQWEYSQKSTRHLITQQNILLLKAFSTSYGVIYIHPDCIYSDNVLDYVAKLIKDEFHLIFCPGFRVQNKQIFIDYVKKRIRKNSKKNELSNYVYNNLNIYHQEQFLNNKIKSKYPSTHIWKVNNGLLIREFHEKVPLFISNYFKDTKIINGIDSDYDVSLFKKARNENKKIKYIDNSDNALIASLVKEDYTLLDRWRVNGNLNDPNTVNNKNIVFNFYYLNKIKFYIKSYVIFNSPLQIYSSNHLYKLNINNSENCDKYFFNKLIHKIISTSLSIIVNIGRVFFKCYHYVKYLKNLLVSIIIKIFRIIKKL